MLLIKNLSRNISSFLASKKFLYVIVIFFSVQALWVALSFRYPMVFDEQFHFDVISIYDGKPTPFLGSQPVEWDQFGPLETGSHGIYHYIMSFPYRFFQLFTNDQRVIITLLRVLNIGLVSLGLILYAKLFRLIKIRQQYINVAILLFTLLPIVSLVSAHISYDNMLFPLTALFLIYAVKIVQAKRIKGLELVAFAAIGLLVPLIKFTFFPVLALSGLFIALVLYKQYGNKLPKTILEALKQSNQRRLAISLALLTIVIGLFIAMPVKNTIMYGSVTPRCAKVLGEDRCDKLWVNTREQAALATKDQRKVDISNFNLSWYDHMTLLGNTGSNTTSGKRETTFPPQIIRLLTTLGPIIGIGGILYAWTGLRKTRGWYLLLFVSVGLLLSVYYINLTDYMRLHTQFANQARYNLSIIPIFVVMSVVAYAHIFRTRRWAKYGILVVVLLLFSQGGGAITHIIKSGDTWYWNDQRVLRANHAAKKLLQPFVIEKY